MRQRSLGCLLVCLRINCKCVAKRSCGSGEYICAPSGVAVLDASRCQVKVCLIIYVKLLLL